MALDGDTNSSHLIWNKGDFGIKLVIGKKEISSNQVTLLLDAGETLDSWDPDDVSTYNYTYTGTAHTPEVTVKYGDVTLTKDTDYEITINQAETNAGSYTVTVTGMSDGDYDWSGSKNANFSILPATVSLKLKDGTAGTTNASNPMVTYSYDGNKAYPGSAAANWTMEDSTSDAIWTLAPTYDDETKTLTYVLKKSSDGTALTLSASDNGDGTAVQAAIVLGDGILCH